MWAFFGVPQPLSVSGEPMKNLIVHYYANELDFGSQGSSCPISQQHESKIKHDSGCPPLWENGQFSEHVVMNKEETLK